MVDVLFAVGVGVVIRFSYWWFCCSVLLFCCSLLCCAWIVDRIIDQSIYRLDRLGAFLSRAELGMLIGL